MANINYSGKNYFKVEGHKIQSGDNEIRDEDLQALMQQPSFMDRVNKGLIKLPKGFQAKESNQKSSKADKAQSEQEIEEEGQEKPSSKQKASDSKKSAEKESEHKK